MFFGFECQEVMLFLVLNFVNFFPVFNELTGIYILNLEKSGRPVPFEYLFFLDKQKKYLNNATTHVASHIHKPICVPIGSKKNLVIGFLFVKRRYNDDRPDTHERFLCVKDFLDDRTNRVFDSTVGKKLIGQFGLFDCGQNKLLEQSN